MLPQPLPGSRPLVTIPVIFVDSVAVTASIRVVIFDIAIIRVDPVVSSVLVQSSQLSPEVRLGDK